MKTVALLIALAALGCNHSATPDAGGSSGTGGATTGGNSTGGTGASSSSGGSSSTGGIPSPYVDGGYVFCSLPNAADGGIAHWLCHPGTYFCDQTGSLGNCDQCRSDADCADQSLPTYDPRRQRCDLDSGVPGYQNFCQECLFNSDCTSDPAAIYCDLNPDFPPDGLQPSIETLGFETCEALVTDCRLFNGPVCREFGERCDSSNGRCVKLPTSCTTDDDCRGQLTNEFYQENAGDAGSAYLLQPYCVDAGCSSCPASGCPNDNQCQSDADCGNSASSSSLPICDPTSHVCVCTSSSQCSGFWPACVGLDGGKVNGLGQAIGICSCDQSDQCGDGGLVCLPAIQQIAPRWPGCNGPADDEPPQTAPTIWGPHAGARFCGVPCTSPEFQSCSALTGHSVCDPASGLCESCTDNEQCEFTAASGGPACNFYGPDCPPFSCVCLIDADCPYSFSCRSAPQLGCVASFSRCTPTSCGDAYYCNWDSGSCTNALDFETFPSCLSDFDCVDGVCLQGTCSACRVGADCAAGGAVEATHCCLGGPGCPSQLPTCTAACSGPQDCIGNSHGPRCSVDAGSAFRCGCARDSDCAGNPRGALCDTNINDGDYGECVCRTGADCPAGEGCGGGSTDGGGICGAQCLNDRSCSAGFFCDPGGACRPRCDETKSCLAPDRTCDRGNAAGQNGRARSGDAGDVTWCYQCLDSRDCSGGLGCSGNSCQPCTQAADCTAGALCLEDGRCHATCESPSACPSGQVCDLFDETGPTLADAGSHICYQCLHPSDCPDGQGCHSVTHTCGTCLGPNSQGGPYDCPPDSICSDYWRGHGTGVCLQNCDRLPCPDDAPLCAVFPALTPDHAYCFGCLENSDCADAGPGTYCDLSRDRTFQCRSAAHP